MRFSQQAWAPHSASCILLIHTVLLPVTSELQTKRPPTAPPCGRPELCCTSAGKDHVAKAWLAAESKTRDKASGSPAQTAVFRGHTDGVAGVAANQQHVCTASWDTTLQLWPASKPCPSELHRLARRVEPLHRE